MMMSAPINPPMNSPRSHSALRGLAVLAIIAGAWFAAYSTGLSTVWLNAFFGLVFTYALVMLCIQLTRHVSTARTDLRIHRELLARAVEQTGQAHLERLKAQAEYQEALARALKAEKEAQYAIVTAKHDEQVYVREADPHATWKPLHLIPAHRINGVPAQPTALELGSWQAWLAANNSPRLSGLSAPPAALPSGPAYGLPIMVHWHHLIPGQRGDLNNLVLGVYVNELGQLQPLTVSLYDLFHTIAAASSGWGKSVFVNGILAQLATCPDPVEFVLIDQQDHGLAAFRNCDRLRYPLLREPGEILSALRDVYQEAVLHRSELLRNCDADDLAEYNRRADTPLSPIVVAVDEASALLAHKEIGAELKRHAWELRKFGIYQFLMLTSAKSTTIDSDHRQQFSSKIQLHANERGQARLLLDAPPEDIINFPRGRAVIELPGQPRAVVQTPYIDKRQVRALLRPASQLPDPPPLLGEGLGERSEPTDRQRHTLALWDAGQRADSAIARQVYGDGGGRQCELVRATLEKFGRLPLN